jgi:hypothetical protein
MQLSALHSHQGDTDRALQHNIALHRSALLQLATFVMTCDASMYHAKMQDCSSIGMHTRHVIEFYQEWLRCCDEHSTSLCYDNRKRNMILEHDQHSAHGILVAIEARLDTLNMSPHQPLILECMSEVGELYAMPSTFLREGFFVHDHTLHHMAIIAMIAKHHGIKVDCAFGVAQSTLQHRASQG